MTSCVNDPQQKIIIVPTPLIVMQKWKLHQHVAKQFVQNSESSENSGNCTEFSTIQNSKVEMNMILILYEFVY